MTFYAKTIKQLLEIDLVHERKSNFTSLREIETRIDSVLYDYTEGSFCIINKANRLKREEENIVPSIIGKYNKFSFGEIHNDNKIPRHHFHRNTTENFHNFEEKKRTESKRSTINSVRSSHIHISPIHLTEKKKAKIENNLEIIKEDLKLNSPNLRNKKRFHSICTETGMTNNKLQRFLENKSTATGDTNPCLTPLQKNLYKNTIPSKIIYFNTNFDSPYHKSKTNFTGLIKRKSSMGEITSTHESKKSTNQPENTEESKKGNKKFNFTKLFVDSNLVKSLLSTGEVEDLNDIKQNITTYRKEMNKYRRILINNCKEHYLNLSFNEGYKEGLKFCKFSRRLLHKEEIEKIKKNLDTFISSLQRK
jgi:hypothetical protein